ncbi:ubiquitin-like protein 7 [Anopheles aquasalis]|uniref:ubiquitin-like protein 7 n=1 Tax=Anopheles aquasalis TaxID=42839 RepID=UPI00215B485B|nr:ubiquitin-like protein 7 [Anopheles aquasalis]
MVSIYLGVHLPFKPYQKLKIDNFDLNSGTETLRTEAAKLIKGDVAMEEFVFLYCGSQLKKEDTLQSKGIRDGSMIHVIQQRQEQKSAGAEQQRPFTEADVQEMLGIWRTVDSSNFQKVRQPEFMKNALDAHPAIRGDLFVLSMLKDPILLSSMQQPETIRRVAEKHRVLIDASRAIVKLLNSKMISKVNNYHLSAPMDNALDDPLSDSSSSDENTASPTTSNAPAMRRITADQLASALAFAGSGTRSGSGYNSLTNISQRDADNRESQQDSTGMEATDNNQPSTSSASSGPVATAAAAGETSSTEQRITSSMLMDAISMMFQQRGGGSSSSSLAAAGDNNPSTSGATSSSRATQPAVPAADEPMDTSPATGMTVTADPATPMGDDLGAHTQSQHSSIAARLGQYRSELELMREMGLADTETNLQALIVCNGNVESAVNLVLSGMNN